MSTKKKIFIIMPPIYGYTYCVSSMVFNLCQNSNIKCIFYGVEETRGLIEQTGSEFRQYAHPTLSGLKRKPLKELKNDVWSIINYHITFSYEILPSLINDVENEKPDLIIYGQWFLAVKYLLEILKVRYEKRLTTTKPPRSVLFDPSFAMNLHIIDNLSGLVRTNIKSIFPKIKAFFRQFIFSWRFGISIYNPKRLLTRLSENLNIFSVLAEIQPNLELFDRKTCKFVGACISEPLRRTETYMIDASFEEILEIFPPRNSSYDYSSTDRDLKLIFVSLGTLFNVNLFVFEAIIDSIIKFDQVTRSNIICIKSNQLKILMSVGDVDEFRRILDTKTISLPSNIILCSKVPQLEILKRASLFITHAGMNSTNEAIHYGVPMISIPIDIDQPMVAQRVCDQLELGIRFDPLKLNRYELAEAIHEILTRKKYIQRVMEFSKISQSLDGSREASNLILNFLNISYDEKKFS